MIDPMFIIVGVLVILAIVLILGAFTLIGARGTPPVYNVSAFEPRNPIVTHKDGKQFRRNDADQWMPL